MNWQRVTRREKCPICHKDSWCMIAPKGDAVLCMRESSSRPHNLKSGEVGYFHQLKDAHISSPHRKSKPDPEPAINVGKIMEQWRQETSSEWIDSFAKKISVQPNALRRLGCAWSEEHRAWGFPMSDGYGNLTGIRLRTMEGAKFAVRGSHTGIFLPGCESYKTALVCEGPTDTAAALTLGFYAIGRPSCSGGVPHIVTAFRRLGVTSAIIIADNDEAGVGNEHRGAVSLQRHLKIRSALIVLPAKDLREFISLSGTRDLLDTMIENLVWETQP